jgi:membrane-associated PAP2 superfamily phosphatase
MTNRIWYLLLFSGLVIYGFFSDGRIDLWVSQALYNTSAHAFYLTSNEFSDVVLYRRDKWLMGGVTLGLVCWGFRQISLKQSGYGMKHQAVGIIGTLLIIGLVDE